MTYMGYPFLQAHDYSPGRLSGQPTVITIHRMEVPLSTGMASAVARAFHNGPPNPASAHVCIDPNTVIWTVRAEDTAYHAGTHANRRGIGIELAGYSKNDDWGSASGKAMLTLAAKVAAGEAKRWGIPVVRLTPTGLIGGKPGFCEHHDWTKAYPGDTTHTDPGPYFPWQSWLDQVNAILNPTPGPGPAPKRTLGGNMPFMYVRALDTPVGTKGHAILVDGGKQVRLENTGLHSNDYSNEGVPYATHPDATQDAVYDKAYGPVIL